MVLELRQREEFAQVVDAALERNGSGAHLLRGYTGPVLRCFNLLALLLCAWPTADGCSARLYCTVTRRARLVARRCAHVPGAKKLAAWNT